MVKYTNLNLEYLVDVTSNLWKVIILLKWSSTCSLFSSSSRDLQQAVLQDTLRSGVD